MLAIMLMALVPAGTVFAADVPSLDDPVIYHTTDNEYRSGDCVLTACKYMIRRAAVLRESPLWTQITNASVRKTATNGGNSSTVKNSFYYSKDGIKYTVGSGNLTGDNADEKKAMLAGLLNKYKYGVVVYGSNASSNGSHAVLAVQVKNSTIYAVDPAFNTGNENLGVQKWNSTLMKSISKCDKYWVITKVSGGSSSASKGNAKSTLKISDVTAPEEIQRGKSFTIKGIVESNYHIKKVTIKISDSKGKTIISKSAKPGKWSYNLKGLDPQIKFGSLELGSYKYTVSAKDEKKSKKLYEKKFKVYSDEKSKLKIKSASIPNDTIKKGKKFSVKGIVKSNFRILNVKVSVMSLKNGKVMYSAKAKPGSKSYNINKLGGKIKFGKLKKGRYIYSVTAKDEKKSKKLVWKEFRVK